jgi:cysteine synthase
VSPFELPDRIVDEAVVERTARHLKARGVRLPTFAELADPRRLPPAVTARLRAVDPDAADAANLYRVHWFNDDARRGLATLPAHLELPSSLTGVRARIVVLLGHLFPMIDAHKVLAAYGCLAPRLATGAFDPERHRAVWPSTGNYCRGGIAISRILGCRGVAVLPEGMSAERFRWLERWVGSPEDIVPTPGSESNVKEIYDKCAELEASPENAIINQFSEFANYLVHLACTGPAAGRVFDSMREKAPDLRLAAFVAATGSAGTIAAGDHLKDTYGARIVAVEPLECPTLLYNGYGEHNIQGVGDKHLPLIHNVMNTDVLVGVSDRGSDGLDLVFNTEVGRRYLVERRRVPEAVVSRLGAFGLSGIANVLAAIKLARRLELDEDEVVLTVATDGAALYASERDKTARRLAPDGLDMAGAAELVGQHLLGGDADHVLEMTRRERNRVFNLGYYTWVEQQGIALEDFDRRRHQGFWRDLRRLVPVWDRLIEEMNARSGVSIEGGQA